MTKLTSTIVLIILGILLSTTLMSRSNSAPVVELTDSNHVFFSGQVTAESVAQAQIKLAQISKKLDKNEVIYLVLDTPGGSVTAGNLFIDFAKSLPQQIKPICIFCASMGYHFLQSFGERLVYSSSTLMSHRASLGGISGQFPGELETRLNSIRVTLNQMDDTAAKRVGMSREEYQKLIYNELWLDGASAVKTKHADRLAKIRCSDDLATGTRSEVVNTMFGPVDVTYSKCPLISGVLGVKFAKEARFRSTTEAMMEVRKTKRSVLWNF